MGDFPYISSERWAGLIIRTCTELIYEYTIYRISVLYIPLQELRAEEGGGLVIHHGLIIRTIQYGIGLCFLTLLRVFLVGTYGHINLHLAYYSQQDPGSDRMLGK